MFYNYLKVLPRSLYHFSPKVMMPRRVPPAGAISLQLTLKRNLQERMAIKAKRPMISNKIAVINTNGWMPV
jgi:hypothetical protein